MDFISPKVKRTFESLFAPNPVQPQVPDVSQVTNDVDPLSIMMTPQNQASTRLNEILSSMPQREDYQPSRMTSIMGRIGGLSAAGGPIGISGGQPIGYRGGGLDVARLVNSNLNQGFNQAMGDWAAQIKPAGELAEAERAANTNQRLTAATLLRDEKADKDRQSREDIAGEKLDLEKSKLEQKREYAAIVKAKNEMPNAAMAEDKDGRVYTWDKKTGQFMNYLTNDEGNIVESSKLPEQQKLEIQQGNELQKIVARGTQSRQTVAAQGQKEIDVSNKTLGNKKDLKQTIPGKNTTPVEGKTSTTGNDKLVTVVDSKGNAYTIANSKAAAFLKQNPTWKVQ